MLKYNIHACAIARKTRKKIQTASRRLINESTDSDYRVSTDTIVALKWMDKNHVLFISNFHNAAVLTEVFKSKKDGSKGVVV